MFHSKVTCYSQNCTYAMRSEGNERTRSDELSHHDKVDHDHPTTHAEASRRQSAYKKRYERRQQLRTAGVGEDDRL